VTVLSCCAEDEAGCKLITATNLAARTKNCKTREGCASLEVAVHCGKSYFTTTTHRTLKTKLRKWGKRSRGCQTNCTSNLTDLCFPPSLPLYALRIVRRAPLGSPLYLTSCPCSSSFSPPPRPTLHVCSFDNSCSPYGCSRTRYVLNQPGMGRFALLCLALLAVKTTALVTRRESDPRLPPPKAVPYIKFIKHDDIEARWDVPRGVETQRKPGSQQLYSVQPTDGPGTIVPASSVRFVSNERGTPKQETAVRV
jgi:hypothetical protein